MNRFYIFIFAICVFSCTEREDLLPEVDRDKAYYTDHSPKLEWSAKVSVDDSTYSLIEGKPEIVGDLVLTRIPRKHLLKTYDYHTGNLLWSINVEQYLGRFGEDNFAALDIGGILHIIDRDDGKVVRLLKESGEVLGSFDPEDHGLRVRGGIEAVVINDFYLMLNYVSLGKYSIIKYNFVDNTYETIGTIEEYEELDYYSKPQFLDSEGKLYFTATVNRNMKGTFSVDILSGEITRIWMGNFDFIFYDQYNVTDDLLILADHWGKVMAISKASGEMVWKYEDKYLGSIRKIIRKGESLYISAKDKIASLDLMTGELNWDLSGPNFLDYVETYEQEELLISINYDLDDNGLVIFDMNNGQKLINLRLPQPDSQYARLFTHIEDKGEVIIASQFDLFKYSDILP